MLKRAIAVVRRMQQPARPRNERGVGVQEPRQSFPVPALGNTKVVPYVNSAVRRRQRFQSVPLSSSYISKDVSTRLHWQRSNLQTIEIEYGDVWNVDIEMLQ